MTEFQTFSEKFADIRILRYQVPGFDQLPLQSKIYAYHLSQAALWGRDIFWDQNYKHNLFVRRNLEYLYRNFQGDRMSDCFMKFEIYLKRIWFANGIHHHYSNEKILPDFDRNCFENIINQSDFHNLNINPFKDKESWLLFFYDTIFNPQIDHKKTNQDDSEDLIKASSINFYDSVTQEETENFYEEMVSKTTTKISLGLNSKLVKENGSVSEKIWKSGGLYGEYIDKIIFHLKEACKFAENKAQEAIIAKLVQFYETGDLEYFDEYNILWVRDTESTIDFINGFIETYDDPLGRKASWESTVQMTDLESDKRVKTISNNAEWFEKNSPIEERFKKEKVEGVSAKAINVIMEGGATSPATPIGINLPNADWIRKEYGSKSVTISNIIAAYDEASKGSGAIEEFAFSEEEIRLSKEFGTLGSNLHVDMHEIIGHGSGKMAEGVGEANETLKNHASTIEETRADLVALYYAIDSKLIELGLMESIEPGLAEYNSYIRGGLMTQLVRVELGKNLEEAHMRNRQLIAAWAYELGKNQHVIEKKTKDNKTYFVINDYQALRAIFGKQLREIQRIKSEGDFDAAQKLIEKYAIKIDPEIHEEVLERWKKLDIPPYSGFLNPKLIPVFEHGEIKDITIEYPNDFAKQMIEYSSNYSL